MVRYPHTTKVRFAGNSCEETIGHNVQFYLEASNEYVDRSLKKLELYVMSITKFAGPNWVLMQPLLLEIAREENRKRAMMYEVLQRLYGHSRPINC